MIEKQLKELKKGDWFTRKPLETPTEKQVFIKRDFIRQDKKYICERFSNMNDCITLKGTTKVYIEFTF